MAQLLVRNLEDDVKERLQRRAKKHGCSLEELVRDILRDAAKDTRPTGGLGSEIAALFRGKGFKKGEIQELRGYPVKPAQFDE
ncbi:MAG TPA: plasmid stabilization protein [Stellaceae bacterium]|nr:plasmid stabilization protein [Stellaceae bacterium]